MNYVSLFLEMSGETGIFGKLSSSIVFVLIYKFKADLSVALGVVII
jgi:hypothetical protein